MKIKSNLTDNEKIERRNIRKWIVEWRIWTMAWHESTRPRPSCQFRNERIIVAIGLAYWMGRATGHSERTFFASEERSLLVLLGQSDVFVEARWKRLHHVRRSSAASRTNLEYLSIEERRRGRISVWKVCWRAI